MMGSGNGILKLPNQTTQAECVKRWTCCNTWIRTKMRPSLFKCYTWYQWWPTKGNNHALNRLLTSFLLDRNWRSSNLSWITRSGNWRHSATGQSWVSLLGQSFGYKISGDSCGSFWTDLALLAAYPNDISPFESFGSCRIWGNCIPYHLQVLEVFQLLAILFQDCESPHSQRAQPICLGSTFTFPIWNNAEADLAQNTCHVFPGILLQAQIDPKNDKIAEMKKDLPRGLPWSVSNSL